MRIGSLFSGYGGLDLAVEAVTGATPAWFVEFDQAPGRVLAHHWPDVPNYGDITAVDWATVEPVDILTGGFPCQDLSHAGKRLGLRPGTRSGLWEHMAYAIDQLRPRMVVIENVRGLLSASAHSDLERDCWCVGDDREPALRALGAVLGDLAELGYDARWGGVRAADAGAPHGRFRVFIVAQPADADVAGLEGRGDGAALEGGSPSTGPAAEGDRAPDRPGRAAYRCGARQEPHGCNSLTSLQAPCGAYRCHAHMREHLAVCNQSETPSLPTPRAQAREYPYARDDYHHNLEEWVGHHLAGSLDALLPTPRAQNGEDCNNLIWARPAGQPQNLENAQVNFGPYAAAVARWEAVLGRPAPSPTEPGKDGRPRLSPSFVEFLMGLPLGHVTDPAIGLSRAQQLKALGNGVVPQQAALALRLLRGLGGVGVANHGTLLPTPNPFHAGNEEDPDEWRKRRADVFKRTGTRHGPALGVVAKSLVPGETPDTYMPDEED